MGRLGTLSAATCAALLLALACQRAPDGNGDGWGDGGEGDTTSTWGTSGGSTPSTSTTTTGTGFRCARSADG